MKSVRVKVDVRKKCNGERDVNAIKDKIEGKEKQKA